MKHYLSFCTLVVLFFIIDTPLFGQSNQQNNSLALVEVKLVDKPNKFSVFSFELGSLYNEIQTSQQVRRFETITQHSISFKSSNGRLEVRFDPTKFSEEQLNNFISGLVVIHGYKDYAITKK